ncbi:MAG: dihydroorotase [Alphaproteobacteria bacterium]
MAETFDLAIIGGQCWTPEGLQEVDIGVRAGRIAKIGSIDPHGGGAIIKGEGLTILPGVIDSQVHFREPGAPHKEDLETGTRAAVLGGVTTVFEMPNTQPPTTDATQLADKLARAKGRAWCDHAFFIGAAAENARELAELERLPGCCGVKIFMGSSTGSLLVPDDDTLRTVLRSGRRRAAIHAEDEPRLKERAAIAQASGSPLAHPEWRDVETARRATARILRLARETGRRIHVLHVTTAEEMMLLAEAKDIATVEVTPQHLTLEAPDCYRRLGTKAQMNPPIRDGHHRQALWQAISQGIVDCIGSDHAPHTLEEKAKPYPTSPSGMPGVQTLLPLLLHHMQEGRLSLGRLVDLTSAGPARIYNVANKGRIVVGYDADFTIVDLNREKTIESSWLASRCGWSPFEGMRIKGWPIMTVIRGHTVMRDDEVQEQAQGMPVRFTETLAAQA